jgi:hypothetical protein
MRYWTILRLKLVDLLSIRGLIVVFALVPLLLGLIAGTANTANQRPYVSLAVVDLDQTPDSLALVSRLRQNDWDVEVMPESKAARLLVQQKIDGVITIDAGYAAGLSDLKETYLQYVAIEGSLVTTLVREAVAAAVLPDYSRRYLFERIRRQYGKIGREMPDGLEESFREAINAYAAGDARLKVEYIGSIKPVPALTYVASDYSMEIIFLSIYAILGVITLSRSDLRRRLAAARYGILLDYTASLAALFLIGFGQVLIYTASMRLLMQIPFRLDDVLLISAYLILMLGLGQLLSLIGESLRLYLSLLLILLSAVAGGCFFQLSEKLLRNIGQYTPHGWILSRLRGFPSLPAAIPLALAILLLVLGYFLQQRRAISET